MLRSLQAACTLLAMIHCLLSIHGFAPPRIFQTTRTARTPEDRAASNFSRRFVFERMSEDAIQALGAAQKLASQYKLTSVDVSCVLAGCVQHPDTSALQRTFRRYKITLRRLQTTLSSQYGSSTDEPKGWLAGFRAAEKDEDLSFDASVQRTLRASGKLADKMQSTTIYSHHIVLSLLEYSNEPAGKAAINPDISSEAWKTLVALNVMDDGVTALQFCETLVSNLQDDKGTASASSSSSSSGELVTGTGGSSKTPTLEEVGVDLTQQAKEGLLDPVFGRDMEIRACVRTLIRRRKNCVCLIGDAVRCVAVW